MNEKLFLKKINPESQFDGPASPKVTQVFRIIYVHGVAT